MDELGNIESSPSGAPAETGGKGRSAEDAQDCWDDDASYLEALDEVERTVEDKEEIPDELMMQALAECEATLA